MTGDLTTVRIHRQFLVEPLLLDMGEIGRAADIGELVGSCSCGGYLFVEGTPGRVWSGLGPVWVSLVCRGCGHEIAAPDGRLARQHHWAA